MQVADQVVVVTGASRGIGAAAARELHARGARVALLGRDAAALAAVAGPLGDRAVWLRADVRDDASLRASSAAVLERFGRVDALVANAGLNRPGTIRSAPADEFAEIVDTNLVGTYRTVQAFLPALVRSHGYALLMSSIASSVGLGGQSAYAASKAGVESLARTLRMETAHLGIAVGSVHPWFADTELLRGGEAAMPSFARLRRRLAPLARLPGPLGLIGLTLTPEQCGVAIAEMVADRSRRRHVPRSAGLLAMAGPVLNSGAGERLQKLVLGRLIRRIDTETVQVLGHRFDVGP